MHAVGLMILYLTDAPVTSRIHAGEERENRRPEGVGRPKKRSMRKLQDQDEFELGEDYEVLGSLDKK